MIKKKVKQRLWTTEEFEIVIDMMKQNKKLSVIAERLNRSYGSVQRKLQYMGKDLWDKSRWYDYVTNRTYNYWTKEELREAKLVLDCGGTMSEAAKKTSHNRNCLSHKINIMGMDFWEERNWDRYVVG
nr:MAG TPA: GcrA cell cycle regulator [Caudoviricetes sp.]